MNKNIIILLVLIAMMIFPIFGNLVNIGGDSTITEGGFEFSVTIKNDISLWGMRTLDGYKSWESTNDDTTDPTQLIKNFYLVRLLFLAGFSLLIISFALLFYPPLASFTYIPLIFGGILSLVAAIMFITGIKTPNTTPYIKTTYEPALYVQLIGAILAIAVGVNLKAKLIPL